MYTVESTGVTPAGTAFTICVEVVGANTIRWGVPTAKMNSANLRGVMYVHGSGGSADYFTTRPVFTTARNYILDNDGFWMECTGSEASAFGGANNWGRDFAKLAYVNAMKLVAGYLSVQDWIFWLRSMGGVVGLWLATMDAYAKSKCVGVIHMSGIYSLLAEFDDGNHFGLPGWYGTADPPTPPARPTVPLSSPDWADWRSSLTAWKALSGTVSARAALSAATVNNDPARIAASAYAGLNMVVIYGTQDDVAYAPIAALALWSNVSTQLGPKSRLAPVQGATHDISGGTFDSPATYEFISDIWELAPPTPVGGTIRRNLSIRIKRPDGMHEISIVA